MAILSGSFITCNWGIPFAQVQSIMNSTASFPARFLLNFLHFISVSKKDTMEHPPATMHLIHPPEKNEMPPRRERTAQDDRSWSASHAATPAAASAAAPAELEPAPAPDPTFSPTTEVEYASSPPLTPNEEKALRGLNSHYTYHLDQVDDPVPGTCEWVASHETLRKWTSLQNSALLWITAEAGCGKSVMAKYLVDHLALLRRFQQTAHICYFFFREGLQDQDNTSAAVSAMLHQLCSSQPRLIQHILAKRASTGKRTFNRIESLWSILQAILKNPSMRDVIWILDGLDECEPNSCGELLKRLAAYLNDEPFNDSTARMKVILLSRPNVSMQEALGFSKEDESHGHSTQDAKLPQESCNWLWLRMEEQADFVAKDIAHFVHFKIAELKESTPASELLPMDHRNILEDRLMKNANGRFLWISLIMKLFKDAAANEISASQLEFILSNTRLEHLYERLLSGNDLPFKGRKALMMVLAAVRPLSLKEICAAIEVHQDHFSEDDEAATGVLLATFGNLAPVPLGGKLKLKGKTPQFSSSLLRQDLTETAIDRMQLTSIAEDQDEQSGATPADIASSSAVQSLDQLGELLHKPFASHLYRTCGHFLRIRGNRVYLVHQTAREFLLARPGLVDFEAVNSWLPSNPSAPTRPPAQISAKADPPSQGNPPFQWQHSIRLEDANRLLLRICADYIRLFQSDTAHNQPPTHWTGKTVTSYLKAIRNNPPRAFFKYAAFHWLDHYRPVRQELDFSFDYLLNPNSPYFSLWIMVHRSWAPTREERSVLNPGGMSISKRAGQDQGKEWKSEEEFGMSLKTANLEDMDRNGWLSGWSKGNGWMDREETGKFEAVLDHFGFSSGEEMELFDEEFLKGERWWKSHGEGEGREIDVMQIPDRVRFYRRQRRAVVMENLGELTNPLSQGGSIPMNLDIGSFFTTKGSYIRRKR